MCALSLRVVTPAEWNAIVDALEELDSRTPVYFKAGTASFTGDGATTEFKIAHGLTTEPTCVMVGKMTSGIPDIDYWTADATYIYVYFKSAPSAGVSFNLWWLALKF